MPKIENSPALKKPKKTKNRSNILSVKTKTKTKKVKQFW